MSTLKRLSMIMFPIFCFSLVYEGKKIVDNLIIKSFKGKESYDHTIIRFINPSKGVLDDKEPLRNLNFLFEEKHVLKHHSRITESELIIADHTVVDRYLDIPQRWIDSVKRMLIYLPGQSHGYGYFRGAELLEQYDSRFQVMIWLDTDSPPVTNDALRLGRFGNINETFYTYVPFRNNVKANVILAHYQNKNPIHAIWFGWSYQATNTNSPGGGLDPVYNVHWAGSSKNGPQGNLRWGLDAEDEALTGNSVCMDTYLQAMDDYSAFCRSNGLPTRMIYSTLPVDDHAGSEAGFQREIKSQYIRSFIKSNSNMILLDYSDILSYNNKGQKHTVDWVDGSTRRPHQQIHPDNLNNYDNNFNIIGNEVDVIEDHIGEVGALRLGKAMWWVLARTAGWDGFTTDIDQQSRNESWFKSIIINDELWIYIYEPHPPQFARLYNMSGQIVSSKLIKDDNCRMEIASLPSGIYILEIINSTIKETRKIIIP